MYKIYMHLSGVNSCDFYRAVLPGKNCTASLLEKNIQLYVSSTLDLSQEFDCYIFRRDVTPDFIPYLYYLKQRGKKIVWDLDDNLFVIPEWSPVHDDSLPKKRAAMTMSLEWADIITLSTNGFVDTPYFSFSDHAAKTVVLPNLIDLDYWKTYLNRSWDVPIITWAGSKTHGKDLEIVSSAVERIARDYQCQFIFVNDIPDPLKLSNKNFDDLYGKVVYTEGTSLMHYPAMMRFIAPSIALLPLIDNEFNRAKSNIKYLEMTMAGAACIASPVGPYADLKLGDVHLSDYKGRRGMYASSSDDYAYDWYTGIKKLLCDDVMRIEMMANATEFVMSTHSWQSEARNTWINFFASLAG